VAIQQPRWTHLAALAFLATLALMAAVPRAARAQSAPSAQSEWTTPVYHPAPSPGAPGTPPPVAPSPAPPAGAPSQPGYAPGYGPPPGYAPGHQPPAYVPPAPPPEPVHGGFFLRLDIGPGFSSFSSSGGASGSTEFSGGGLSLGIALGGALAQNFAVYGTFFEPVMTEMTLKTARTDLAKANNAGLGGIGAGAIYYIEPINLYVSGAIAFTGLVVNDAKSNSLDQTDLGIGFQGMFGKEWWVSQCWGVGAAVEIVAATAMRDGNDHSVSWTGEAFSVVFSASYF
jgi:hypothetical protein